MAISIETLVLAKNFAKSYTDAVVATFPRGMAYRGAVDYYSDLPSDAENGDVYTVKYAGSTGEDPLGVEYGWGTYEGTDQWVDLGPDLSRYQPLLVSGENIKTINGNSILGSGNMIIATNYEFPSSWSSYTSGTTKAFCDVVNADATAVEGMSYLGEVTFSDLPFSGNAEIVVQIMNGTGTSNKVIHLILTSGNVAPYRWEYTYWNNGSNVSGWRTWLSTEGGTVTGDIKLADYNTNIVDNNGNNLVGYKSNHHVKLANSAQRTYIYSNSNDLVHDKAGNEYIILDTSNTSANPTLAGTETALTGLKINGTSYKIPTFDPTTISGYDATKTQVLTNNHGTIEWAEATTFAALNSAQYGTPDVTLFAVADGSVLATSDTSEPVAPAVE